MKIFIALFIGHLFAVSCHLLMKYTRLTFKEVLVCSEIISVSVAFVLCFGMAIYEKQ